MEKHIGYSFGVRSDHDCHEIMWIFKELDLPKSLIFQMFEDDIGDVCLFIVQTESDCKIDIEFPYTENPKSILPELVLMEAMENPNFMGYDNSEGQIISFKLPESMKEWAMEEFAKLQDGDWDWR